MTDEPGNLPLEFKLRLAAAKAVVSAARMSGDKLGVATALKGLGNIERRHAHLRDTSISTYAEAAELYRELGMPLEESWVKRHIGLNHEYAERLDEAERYYDEALELYRTNAAENTLNYANTVRYPAVIKNRVGKRDESTALWTEACERYEDIGAPVGVAEAAAWLTLFALEQGDITLAREWFAKAAAAATESADKDTDKFIAEVLSRLLSEENR